MIWWCMRRTESAMLGTRNLPAEGQHCADSLWETGKHCVKSASDRLCGLSEAAASAPVPGSLNDVDVANAQRWPLSVPQFY